MIVRTITITHVDVSQTIDGEVKRSIEDVIGVPTLKQLKKLFPNSIIHGVTRSKHKMRCTERQFYGIAEEVIGTLETVNIDEIKE